MSSVDIQQILKDTFGHSEFRFHQESIVNTILEGKDVLGVMPTGAGKSICYQVPALYLDGVTLVVSPLISLMQDQVVQLHENGIKACFLNSNLNLKEKEKHKASIMRGDVKIVYVSPEGLLSNSLLSFFLKVNIALIAIDEAHCVSQWGHEFRKDYTRLGELRQHFPSIPFMALTATADSRTRDDIVNQLHFKSHEVFISSFDRPNIRYNIHERLNEIKQLDSFIKESYQGDTGIVYCLSRKKVEKVTESLKKLGHKAMAYHAGLSPEVRREAQISFDQDEGVIIVATIAFGMGINKPDVRFVAHLDLPKSIEGYYQETGRAGRDGEKAQAWMVYGLQDVMKLSQMLETTDANESYKKNARLKLDAMLSLCETLDCRRDFLLSYFEEKIPKPCGNCDTCLNPAETFDASIDAQKVLSTIYRTGQVYGAGYIIDVLRGSLSSKVLERGHDKLTVHGIGKDKPLNHWNFIIRHLLNGGYLRIKNWEYRNFGLTEKSGEILKGEVSYHLRKKSLSASENKNTSRKVDPSLSEAQNSLFQELKALRKSLAQEGNVPAYIIFPDKSLLDMCHLMPRNKEEFLLVNGVGVSKCERYAQAFMQVING